MASSPATVEASTLSGAHVQRAQGNTFMNIGRDRFEFTFNNHGSGLVTTVFDILTTMLIGIFRPRASEIDPISIPQQSMNARDHSEPTATVTEIQDVMASAPLSVLDTFNSTVSPLTQSSSSERYIRSMLECNQGYPLYEPEPRSRHCQEGVRVGDVGLVTEDGGFDCLFNVCPPPDTCTNSDELPDDFEMLRSPEILVKTHFQSETRLFSNGIKRTGEPDVKYTCSGPEGGVLELPLGATRFEAPTKASFKRLAIRHAENWYRYAVLTRDRDALNGSLYIVTSCIKCADWGMAVFDRPSNPQDYLRFITNEEDQNGQSKHRWNGSGAYISKVALNRGSADSNDADGLNQCVFLRGYKIMLRKDIWDNIMNSQFTGTSYITMSPYTPRSGNKSKSPHQGSFSNQDDPSQSRLDNNYGSDCGTTRAAQNTCSRTDTSARVILYEYSKTSPAHPSDLINAILLCHEQTAKVALTHDDDWCDLLQYHSQTLDSAALAKVGLPYTSNVDEYGCASLKRVDLNRNLNVTVGESGSDTRITPTSEKRLLIDNTKTNPTKQLPSLGDDLALVQQDYLHPFDATTRSFMPHSQSSHHFILSTTATVGSGDATVLAKDKDKDTTTLTKDDDDVTVLTKKDDRHTAVMTKNDDNVTVLTKEDDEDTAVLMKDEDATILTKDDDDDVTVFTKDEDNATVLTKEDDEDVTVLTKDDDKDVTILTKDDEDDTTVLTKDDNDDIVLTKNENDDLNVLTKCEGDNEGATVLTKDGDVNILTKNEHVNVLIIPRKTFLIVLVLNMLISIRIVTHTMYRIAYKCTRWKESIQQTITKDDNVLNKSWKAFWKQNKYFRWSVIAALLFLIISIFIPIWDRSPPKFTGDVNYVCQSPKIIQPWQIKAFRPRWFGLFGGPGPITYKAKGRNGHRVSVVGIDRRDIEIEMFIDDKDFGHRPVDLDSTVRCGDDLANCINMGFAAAMISVPPGKHLVRAEILDVNGTFRWGYKRNRRVWWMVEECS